MLAYKHNGKGAYIKIHFVNQFIQIKSTIQYVVRKLLSELDYSKYLVQVLLNYWC